ncbi:metallophosphoesterase family protein [Psychroserpens algicola]|uniref:Metallophosphoesterase n=1 Tax=Psychroserpens algicola TaxID=1719034 RepID=A0ABT0HBQ6_9FLAO|nr:metallophosphoesterase [Psychroserpens algicola]MCK8481785.1 metallophosphoesterase [Psychroserpens algicola]
MKFKIIYLACFLFVGCSSSGQKKLKHSFFVAGHTYGNQLKKKETNGNLKGLHPAFKQKFAFLREQPKMKMGFLLGDTVWRPQDWPDAIADIETIGIPVEVVRGNHDGNLKSFKNKFGETYKSFITDNNLYIILDTNLDHWNITGDQMIFLKNTLRNETKNIDNIFILSHHLLWYSKDKIPEPTPNSLHKTEGKTNFWKDIEPLLRAQKVPVYLFAGDVAAFYRKRDKDKITEFYYHEQNNLTFIATGMGGEVRDNLVITDVYDDGSVEFRLIYLNGNNINELGKLEDYSKLKKDKKTND